MSSHINFVHFINILKNNNVNIFDGEMRIAHFRFNKLLQQLPQKGGSSNKSIKLLDKICNNKTCLLDRFVSSLLNNNINLSLYIIDHVI
jgi:hypothetical protein